MGSNIIQMHRPHKDTGLQLTKSYKNYYVKLRYPCAESNYSIKWWIKLCIKLQSTESLTPCSPYLSAHQIAGVVIR